MSADEELGLVYLPVESATGDRYGGDRPGNNLYSSSTVALDYKTGEVRWHFQSTHHDIWDWDTPSAPILADLPDGRKTLIQTLKQSHLFTFDRATGTPLFPIEERPVPQTDVPGEWTALTQPFPSLPLPYDRQGFQEDDLVDFTPEILAKAREAAQPFRFSTSVFTPPSLFKDPKDGSHGTLHLPSSTGGSNWEGVAYDPEIGLLYVPSRAATSVLSLVNEPDVSSVAYIAGGSRTPSVDGIPLVKPPYGRITAIDMSSGEHVWQVVNGDTPEDIRHHPLLQGVDIGRTGKPARSGLVLTKTLLFAGFVRCAASGSANVTVSAVLRRADSSGLRECGAAAAHSATSSERACPRLWHTSEGLAPGSGYADRWPPGRRPPSLQGWIHGVSADPLPGTRPGIRSTIRRQARSPTPNEDAP